MLSTGCFYYAVIVPQSVVEALPPSKIANVFHVGLAALPTLAKKALLEVIAGAKPLLLAVTISDKQILVKFQRLLVLS
jgi:hypothetical protein